MLSNISLSGKKLFELIVKEKFNKKPCTERRQGWLFESLCQIIISLKCVENLHYTEINDGQLQSLKKVNNIQSLLKVSGTMGFGTSKDTQQKSTNKFNNPYNINKNA